MSHRYPTKQVSSSSSSSSLNAFSSSFSSSSQTTNAPLTTSSTQEAKDAKGASNQNFGSTILSAEEFESLNDSESWDFVDDVKDSKPNVHWHEKNDQKQIAPGETRLHVVAREGRTEEVNNILETEEGREWVMQMDVENRTPLYIAVKYGRVDIVKKLLASQVGSATAPVWIGLATAAVAEGQGGMTPLHEAAAKGYYEIVEALLERAKEAIFIDQKAKNSYTPLIVAVMSGHINIAIILIRHKANYQDDRERLRDLAKGSTVKEYCEGLLNLEAALHLAGIKETQTEKLIGFKDGLLVNALEERIFIVQGRASAESKGSMSLIDQFWRNAGVGGGKEKEFSEAHPWLVNAIKAQPALSSFLFDSYSCFQEKLPGNIILENAKKVRIVNDQEQIITISYIFTSYSQTNEQGRHSGSATFSPLIIITTNLNVRLGTSRISLAITKKDAALLGLQWYFPGWFSPPERAVSRIKFFLKIFETHADELRNIKSLDPINEKAFIDAYIDPSSAYLKEVIEIFSFQRFLSGDQQDILASLHKIYRANQCSCLVIAVKKFKTDENKVEWLFWQNIHWYSYAQLSVCEQTSSNSSLDPSALWFRCKLFTESKPAEGFTKDVQLQNFLSRVFSQSIRDAIDQFFEEARLRPSYPSGATAASWSPIKLEAILKQKFINTIRQFQASFSNSSSSSTSADSTAAPSADFDTPVEYLRKLALQRSAALQSVVMNSLSSSPLVYTDEGSLSVSSTVNSTNSPADLADGDNLLGSMKNRMGKNDSKQEIKTSAVATPVELNIPGDHSCLFWSVALGVLIPVLSDETAYREAFNQLFVTQGDAQDAALFSTYGTGLKERIQVFTATNDTSLIEKQSENDPLYRLINHYFRQKVASYIASNPQDYTDAVLERTKAAYVSALRSPNFWGGQIEIHAIFSLLGKNYQLEVAGVAGSNFLAAGKPVINLVYTNAKSGNSDPQNHYNVRIPLPAPIAVSTKDSKPDGSLKSSQNRPLVNTLSNSGVVRPIAPSHLVARQRTPERRKTKTETTLAGSEQSNSSPLQQASIFSIHQASSGQRSASGIQPSSDISSVNSLGGNKH